LDVVNVNGVATCRSVVDGSDPNCVPYNVFKLGAVTPAMLKYLQVPGMRNGSTEQQIQGATLASDLGDYGIKMPMAKNGVGVSFGAEHRVEKLTLMTDAATQAGDLSGSGGPTGGVAGQYSVKDIFGEVRVPLIEGHPFVEMLTANGSYRHSKLSTGIDTNTFGAGLEWAPVQGVRFRGSYQKAVRAPNLVELFTPQGNNLFDMDRDPCAGSSTDPVVANRPTATAIQCARTGVTAAQYGTGSISDSPAGQFNYLQGGNDKLTPETAKSKTFGVVLTPMRNLSVTLDYFDIKVDNTIGIIDPATSLEKCLATGDARFCSLIKRDRTGSLWLFDEAKITGTQQNIGGTSTSGLDVGFNYAYKVANLGTLGLNMAGTYLRSLVTEEIKNEGSYDCVGYYGANKCGAPNPKWRHKVRASWSTPWSVDLALTWRHIDKVELQSLSSQPLLAGDTSKPFNGTNAVDRELGQRDYMDLAASYSVTKKIVLTGGINNVFDRDPPLTSQLATGQGNGNTYPSVYDALGRRIFVSMTAKF
jgi:outer membrane receptor protein involved in Fe transport